ncbi:MAG: hypothetical protein Tsb0017_03490 [Geothermobacteraceae bacterium]
MAVVLARIDNRLIHGQVLEAWVPHTRADCVVVANDRVAGDRLRRTMMAACVPSCITVHIDGLEEVASAFARGEFEDRRVLVLFENSSDALMAHRLGLPFDQLNLGNMHAGEGKMRCSCTIALDNGDIANLEALETEEGVKILSQCVPGDRARPWRKLIR